MKNLTKLGQDKTRTWDMRTEDALWAYYVSISHQQELLWARSVISHRAWNKK